MQALNKWWIPAGLVASLACVVAVAQKPDTRKTEPVAETPVEKPKAAKPYSLESFMRKKLDASSKILEGLCQEDAALVKAGAEELSAMSRVEIWNVMLDAEYRQHSIEFRDNAARVAEAAEAGQFDKAALRWFDVTMSCLDCHDHVRKERAARKTEASEPDANEEKSQSEKSKPDK
ncbi:MAG: hypothetical protein DWH91_18090 [Planctomycetota bacterium]|nr:MAG: hypothetical protein DWH91_18090 [Planctomycetota bacterium]